VKEKDNSSKGNSRSRKEIKSDRGKSREFLGDKSPSLYSAIFIGNAKENTRYHGDVDRWQFVGGEIKLL